MPYSKDAGNQDLAGTPEGERGVLLRTGVLQLDLSCRSLGEKVVPATQKVSPEPAQLPDKPTSAAGLGRLPGT